MPDLMIDPRRTAVIVVDMQNAFIRDEGSMLKRGLSNELLQPAVGPVRRIVAAARRAGIPLIFTRYVLRADLKDAGRRRNKLHETDPSIGDSLVRGTWDAELIDELQPEPHDYILDKSRPSSFYNTNLEIILSGEDVDTLIVCGVTTEICVETTVRDASQRDYDVYVPTDAVSAFDLDRHAAALKVIEFGFGTLTTTQQVEDAFAMAAALR